MGSAAEFYDGLAAQYDCLFQDWWESARWHASVIGALLVEQGITAPDAVLDCTCGIGTQALPLAAAGYAITATDVSAVAVDRARAESAARGIALALAVADIRQVHQSVRGGFDAVISCDNALPHLFTDDDLDAALTSVRCCLRPGGLFLASIRDYDALAKTLPSGVPLSMYGDRGTRHASGQAWKWSTAADYVDITLFTMKESELGWSVSTHETTYRALQRSSLSEALLRAGYVNVRWLEPEESGYYQPVVLARAEG